MLVLTHHWKHNLATRIFYRYINSDNTNDFFARTRHLAGVEVIFLFKGFDYDKKFLHGLFVMLGCSSLALSAEDKNVTVDQAIGGMEQGRRISGPGSDSNKEYRFRKTGKCHKPCYRCACTSFCTDDG